jgi:hypothetical protein
MYKKLLDITVEAIARVVAEVEREVPPSMFW